MNDIEYKLQQLTNCLGEKKMKQLGLLTCHTCTQLFSANSSISPNTLSNDSIFAASPDNDEISATLDSSKIDLSSTSPSSNQDSTHDGDANNLEDDNEYTGGYDDILDTPDEYNEDYNDNSDTTDEFNEDYSDDYITDQNDDIEYNEELNEDDNTDNEDDNYTQDALEDESKEDDVDNTSSSESASTSEKSSNDPPLKSIPFSNDSANPSITDPKDSSYEFDLKNKTQQEVVAAFISALTHVRRSHNISHDVGYLYNNFSSVTPNTIICPECGKCYTYNAESGELDAQPIYLTDGEYELLKGVYVDILL